MPAGMEAGEYGPEYTTPEAFEVVRAGLETDSLHLGPGGSWGRTLSRTRERLV